MIGLGTASHRWGSLLRGKRHGAQSLEPIFSVGYGSLVSGFSVHGRTLLTVRNVNTLLPEEDQLRVVLAELERDASAKRNPSAGKESVQDLGHVPRRFADLRPNVRA